MVYATVPMLGVDARLVNGAHFEFDSVAYRGTKIGPGHVSVSTGVGQANGIVTANGFRYLVVTQGYAVIDETTMELDWTTTVGAPILDEAGLSMDGVLRRDGFGFDNTPAGASFQVLDATAPVVMELRKVAGGAATSMTEVLIQALFIPVDP